MTKHTDPAAQPAAAPSGKAKAGAAPKKETKIPVNGPASNAGATADTAMDAAIAEAEARAGAAQQQLEETQQKLSAAEDKFLRTAAEYDNHRKRSAKETESAFNNGVAHAVTELLPVLDTLQTAAACNCGDDEYKKGVVMTCSKCEEVFNKLGIAPIEAMGQPFDPELHNAVMQEAAEGAESGTITREILKGYKLGDRVIRHSMVAVAP